QTSKKRSRKVRNTRMVAASMISAADSWAFSLGSSPAYQRHSGRFIAIRLPERSFCKYHVPTRYQWVLRLPLVTFGTSELGYHAIDSNPDSCPRNASS